MKVFLFVTVHTSILSSRSNVAIPLLTIADVERNRDENKKLREEKSERERKILSMVEDAVRRIRDDFKSDGWRC